MSREKMLNRGIIVSTIKKICSVNYKEFTVSDLIHKGGHRHRNRSRWFELLCGFSLQGEWKHLY
ncbi:MAG: hypothetical protein K0Q77_2031 [Anaerosporomusa subterranea]|jgi:hypothetical protein|nr:hypothetical protein [Anaerosporomusa subterranea]